jgi:hypothetical protein
VILLHHVQEQNYWKETVQVETFNNEVFMQKTFLLRIYPINLNGYDAYMDIPKNTNFPNFKRIYSPRLDTCWEVLGKPQESSISGFFRGDLTSNNPPVWMFGLKLEPVGQQIKSP